MQLAEPLRAADGTPNDIDEETGYSRPPRTVSGDAKDSCCGMEVSNRTILWVSAITFMIFVTAEVVGALASNSLSLLGDAAAMSVDVFTVILCLMHNDN